MAKYKYNFKRFFTSSPENYRLTDDKFVTNGYFIVKKDCLRKPQKDFIEVGKDKLFAPAEYMKIVYDTFKQVQETSKLEDSTEFIPVYTGTESEKKTLKSYKVVLSEEHRSIKEEYYNFFKDIKGEIFYHPQLPDYTPFPVYRDSKMIGLIFPVRPNESINNKVKYVEVKS